MSKYNELGSGDVYTPTTVNLIHFGSPAGVQYTEPEDEE